MTTLAIFGGSGRLGAAVARRMARDYSLLIGYCGSADRAGALAAELQEAGCRAVARRVDLRDGAAVQSFLAEAAALDDGLGGVVSASGARFPICALTDATEQQFREVIDIEVIGTFNVLRHAVPLLRAQGGGPIVLFLTTAVARAMEFDGLNAVPKAAITMMLRQVVREAGRDNVRVNGVAPGIIEARRFENIAALPPLARQMVEECIRNTPLPRLGRPAEVAALVAYLLSAEAGYVSGQIIGLDGGYAC